jgi:seryl-tRNA synthetase
MPKCEPEYCDCLERILGKESECQGRKEVDVANKKEDYINKLDAQLREWSAKIDQLKARSNRVKSDLKLEYDKQLQMLHAKRESAQKKLQELKGLGGQASDEIKLGVKRIWDDLRTTLENTMSKFK